MVCFSFSCANNPPEPNIPDQKPPNNGSQEVANDAPEPLVEPQKISGDTVSLKGTAIYKGEITGAIQLELMVNADPKIQKADPSKEAKLLHRQSLSEFGAFEIQVPSNTENLTVLIYIDVGGNGMNRTDADPQGIYAFNSKAETIENVELTILDKEEWERQKNKSKKVEKEDKKEE